MSRKLRKVGKWLLLIVVSLCVMGFLLLCFERVRGAVSLSSYKQKLARRGEAVSAQDLARSVPQGSNGVAEVLHACRELVEGEVMPEHYPPGMTMTRSGRAIAGFRQHQWTEDKLVYDWNRLDRDLETNRAVLKRIRTALGQPVLDHQLDYSQGPKMPLPHLVRPKELARWFGAQSSLALHEHRLQEAVDPLIAEICLPRFLERDGILISELVRIAIASLARADTWAALQANGWTDEQLAGIQKAWEAQRFLTNFTRGLEGERIYCTSAFELCRASQAETASMLFWMDDMNFMDLADRPAWEKAVRALPAGDALAEFLKEDLYCRVWRFAWLDQCERRYLEAVQGLIEISRRMEATADLVTAEKSIQALLERIENRTVYDSLRFGFGVTSVATLSRGISKAARAETERSLVLAAIALKRYGLSNTNPPASLQHLVPAFLSSVPIDYMNGNPIQYRVKPDESVALYSVGEDGKDDGGDAGLLDASKQWTMWHRRDVVWPTLALPEELEPDELPDAEVIVQASANAATVRSNPPLRVLILSGQNNHNWRETTPRLRMILESEGRFTVEISEQPEHLTNVALEPY
ncbi:MAG TPA: hypothetical protein VN673_14255, partial [Clostridia bacterium]|nr:hypothetical protein [Clostridia bacterium]